MSEQLLSQPSEVIEQYGKHSAEHTAQQIMSVGKGIIDLATENNAFSPGEGSLDYNQGNVNFGESENGGNLNMGEYTSVNGEKGIQIDDGVGSRNLRNITRAKISNEGVPILTNSQTGFGAGKFRSGIYGTANTGENYPSKTVQEVRSEAAKSLMQAKRVERTARPENRT